MTEREIRSILDTCTYKNWAFLLRMDKKDPYLQLRWLGADSETGNLSEMNSRKWLLSYHMTKSEIVQTAFKALLTAEEHEVREHFRYRGKAVFGPHFDVDALWEIFDEQDTRDSL